MERPAHLPARGSLYVTSSPSQPHPLDPAVQKSKNERTYPPSLHFTVGVGEPLGCALAGMLLDDCELSNGWKEVLWGGGGCDEGRWTKGTIDPNASESKGASEEEQSTDEVKREAGGTSEASAGGDQGLKKGTTKGGANLAPIKFDPARPETHPSVAESQFELLRMRRKRQELMLTMVLRGV